MDLNFVETVVGGKEYSCEFLATSDFNLHIEREKNSCYLTQAVDCGEERLFLTMIKGVNVNPENWREVTASEKEALEKDMGLERRANES